MVVSSIVLSLVDSSMFALQNRCQFLCVLACVRVVMRVDDFCSLSVLNSVSGSSSRMLPAGGNKLVMLRIS